jgi:hypothetical protein
VGENISSYTSHPRIYRELKKLNSPKINEPIKKWATEQNKTFSKEEILFMLQNVHMFVSVIAMKKKHSV